jgi:glycosyltransferase involved in cell wall biosynthesis
VIAPVALERSVVRVAHLVEALEVGGLEKLLVDFVRNADRSRFDLRVVTLGARGRLAAEVEALGSSVDALNTPPGLFARARSIVSLARRFRRDRIDVVHTHSEGPLLYGSTAARLAGVKRVIHTRHHGPDLGNSRRAIAAMALATRWVDRVACVSDAGARQSICEGVAASKVVTVWNGIDLDRFAYRGPNPEGSAVIVARLSPEKDHATLLRAASLALRADPGFRLEIAGDGPCHEDLKRLANELELGDCVRFLGRVDDVPALLARASMLVLSSTMEGISLTLLEAMARGLPVVATCVGGNPEVVIDGETGLLVPAGSPAALAHAMVSLRHSPDLCRSMGRAGRERAEQFFDIKQMVSTYESMYLDTNGASRP